MKTAQNKKDTMMSVMSDNQRLVCSIKNNLWDLQSELIGGDVGEKCSGEKEPDTLEWRVNDVHSDLEVINNCLTILLEKIKG